MGINLEGLPYAKDALAPYISAKTLDFHYDKHHNAYFSNLNKLITGTDLVDEDLETIIKKASGVSAISGIFNNAAQVYNHTFYWQSLKPAGGGFPVGAIADKLKADFGSYEKFAEDFKNAGLTQFGSGWAWLVLNNGRLEVIKTANADTPLAHGLKPVLVVDVWEHAYYLDYQNRRPDYLDSVIKNLINWDFANSNIS